MEIIPTLESANYRHFSSRKFIACMVAITLIFIALCTDFIGEIIFRDLMLGTVGVYIAGNVAEKFTK